MLLYQLPEEFPTVLHFGLEGEYYIMVTDYLGPSIEELFKYCDNKFSLKTVLMIADQVVRISYDWLLYIVEKDWNHAQEEVPPQGHQTR